MISVVSNRMVDPQMSLAATFKRHPIEFGESLSCDSVGPTYVTLALCLAIAGVLCCDSRISIKIAFSQSECREKSGVFPRR